MDADSTPAASTDQCPLPNSEEVHGTQPCAGPCADPVRKSSAKERAELAARVRARTELDPELDFNDFAPDGRVAIAVGRRLRELRQRAGMSLAEVARGMGSHRPIVGRLESGRHVPEIATLRRFCSVVGAPLCEVTQVVDELLGWRFWGRA